MAILKTASDARRAKSAAAPLPQSPTSFSGSVGEFFAEVIAPTLLPVAELVAAHRALTRYVQETSPLFLIRAVSGTERRADYQTQEGETFRATDNAPAWWMYASLYAGHFIDTEATQAVVETMPCHMFDVASSSAQVPSKSGWHIAHILPVKDRNTHYRQWTRRDLVRRFIRNVHPANYFLLPNTDWQRLGNDSAIVDFAAALHRERYAEIWDEFSEMAQLDAGAIHSTLPDARVEFGYGKTEAKAELPIGTGLTSANRPASRADGAVTYRATRLLFRRDVIELLGDGDRFRVETPVGDFEMSKAEFYQVFPGVVASKSYREGGIYHFPSPPKRAEVFRRPQF